MNSFRLAPHSIGIYSVKAKLTAGGKLTLADRIPGDAQVDRLVKVYEDWFGEPVEYL